MGRQADSPRLAVYSDMSYRRDSGGISADESFVRFAGAVAERFSSAVLLGRLDPKPGRQPNPVPEGVRFAALPFYASLAQPGAALRAAWRSARTFQRVLDDVDVVWLLGPHPLALLFAVLARARRRAVVLGVRQHLPSYTRLRYRRRWILRLSAMLLELAWRLMGRSCGVIAIGPDLADRYRCSRAVVEVIATLITEADLGQAEQAFDRDYDGELRALSVGRLDPEKNPLRPHSGAKRSVVHDQALSPGSRVLHDKRPSTRRGLAARRNGQPIRSASRSRRSTPSFLNTR